MEQRIFSFGIKEQLSEMLQNVSEVNKERTRLAALSHHNIVSYLEYSNIQQ